MGILYAMGARPNFVKMAPVISALRRRLPDTDHVIVDGPFLPRWESALD